MEYSQMRAKQSSAKYVEKARAENTPASRLPARLLSWMLIWSLISSTSLPLYARARHTSQSITGTKLPPHERALQALNRLTFGPRPGDVERVEAMGVDRWIDQQLNPETIDDLTLEARLDSYPAMRLSEQALLTNYPPDAIIHAAADGKIPLPENPETRAIYNSRIAMYQQKLAEKQPATAALPPNGTTPPPNSTIPASATVTLPVNAPLNEKKASAPPNPAMRSNAFLGQPPAGISKDTVVATEDAAHSPSIKVREQHLYADLAATSILNLPPAARVAKILAMPPADFLNFQHSLTGAEKIKLLSDLAPQQKEVLLAMRNPEQLVAGELLAERFLRDVYSNRQLEAVMTDFWLNHFNVYLHKQQFTPWYLVEYERAAIRPHALGKFEDLLVATAESPAMLTYLDNQQSIGPHSEAGLRAQAQTSQGQNVNPPAGGTAATPLKPKADLGLNENYARELMELHTLGVEGGYTQQDVTQVAEVFTGWGVNPPNALQKNAPVGFNFNPKRHEPGPKTVLGKTINGSGQEEGLQVLHMLATSPITARHISQQLAVRFVSDNPSPALVKSMASTWVSTGGDIKEVLRTMFSSPDFWSRDAYRAKIKTPEEFVLSAVRATGGEVVRPAQELQALDELGMPFFGCQTPNGYSWISSAWVNTGDLLDRMNIAINIAGNKLGVATDMDSLIANLSRQTVAIAQQTSTRQKENWLADILLNGPPTPQTQGAILKQINESALSPAANQAAAAKPVAAADVPRRYRSEPPDSSLPIPPPSDPEASTIAGLLLGSPDFQRK